MVVAFSLFSAENVATGDAFYACHLLDDVLALSDMPADDQSGKTQSLAPRRRWWFRIAAIVFGLALLALVELVLRLVGVGAVDLSSDPYVGFDSIQPLFEPDDKGRLAIAPSRREFFRPDSFDAEKSPREFRIFCLGGSTVQGRPYSIETSFTTWLELSLSAIDPDRKWEVVNCGGVSYASYRLVPILREVLNYEPDLIVLCTGHNEFLEWREYEGLRHKPGVLAGFHRRVSSLHLYRMAKACFKKTPPTRDELNAEVDALLDYQGGMEKYHRDEAWHQAVQDHFEINLQRMLALAKNADVPVVVLSPPSNLRDSPPFKSEPNPDFTATEQRVFESLWQNAVNAAWDDLDQKLGIVKEVVAFDSQHANAQFLLGRVLEQRGEFVEARKAYLRARDYDVCPLRMPSGLQSALQTLAMDSEVGFIDLQRGFEERAKHGITNDRLLADHIHPRIEGHQFIAELLTEQLERMGYVTGHSSIDCEELFEAHISNLPEGYYLQAEERLRGLKGWSAGRATKLAPKPVRSGE